jgi:hypothetical protein
MTDEVRFEVMVALWTTFLLTADGRGCTQMENLLSESFIPILR